MSWPLTPTPQFPAEWFFVSCDWLARYLEGGTKVFVFHTIDHHTHALDQTISTVKTTEAACAHLMHSLTELGVPDFLQIDNDAAFTGLGKKPRVFGHFVRLALHFGIELLFIPPALSQTQLCGREDQRFVDLELLGERPLCWCARFVEEEKEVSQLV